MLPPRGAPPACVARKPSAGRAATPGWLCVCSSAFWWERGPGVKLTKLLAEADHGAGAPPRSAGAAGVCGEPCAGASLAWTQQVLSELQGSQEQSPGPQAQVLGRHHPISCVASPPCGVSASTSQNGDVHPPRPAPVSIGANPAEMPQGATSALLSPLPGCSAPRALHPGLWRTLAREEALVTQLCPQQPHQALLRVSQQRGASRGSRAPGTRRYSATSRPRDPSQRRGARIPHHRLRCQLVLI